jgi:hypothetical protein
LLLVSVLVLVLVDGAAVAGLWALLIWPFAVEKTEEEEAAEKGVFGVDGSAGAGGTAGRGELVRWS